MKKITYSQVFKDITPVEEGDFFKEFSLPTGNFIVFSPERHKLSCVEMLRYKEYEPDIVALLLDITLEDEEIEEFTFEEVVNVDRLLMYIFDARNIEDNGKVNYKVNQMPAYILKTLADSNYKKGFNFFNYLENGKSASLTYDDKVAYRTNNATSDNIIICFDPCIYNRYTSDELTNKESLIYLFGSANAIFFDMIYEMLTDKNTVTLIRGNEEPVVILRLLIHIMNRQSHNSIIFDADEFQIMVGYNSEALGIQVMKLVNKVNESMRVANINGRSIVDEKKAIGHLIETKSTVKTGYHTFRNSKFITEHYLGVLYQEFQNDFKISMVYE